jgi:hemolysin III
VADEGPLDAVLTPRLRGASHLVAAMALPILGAALIAVAHDTKARVAAGVYTVGVGAMYAVSATYHRGVWTAEAKRRLRRLDHSTILVSIAATYTPLTVVGLHGAAGRPLLVAVWTLAIAGVVVRNLWLEAPRWLTVAVYLLVGWLAVVAMPAMWDQLGGRSTTLILLGGLAYSVGAVVYARKRPDPFPATFGYHEVFHAFVVVAGLLMYAAEYRVVSRR